MFDMLNFKKFFVIIFSFLLCASPFCGKANAEGEYINFLSELDMIKQSFVFDKENRDKLTAELDGTLTDEEISTLPLRRQKYHDAVESILQSHGQVKYNCRVLASWAYCKLRKLGVPCQEIIICRKGSDGKIGGHQAVLVPLNDKGTNHWFVCDISGLSETGNFAFACAELTDYVSEHNDNLVGIMVSNDEDRMFDRTERAGCPGGHDVAVWLAKYSKDKDVSYAIKVLESQKTSRIRVLSGSYELDEDRCCILELLGSSGSLTLRHKALTQGVDFAQV